MIRKFSEFIYGNKLSVEEHSGVRNSFMLRESYWILTNLLGENLWIPVKASQGESPREWILAEFLALTFFIYS